MSKGILIIDRFPEACVDCDFFTNEDGTIDFKCSLTGRTNLATLHERFSDCPLKEAPKKKTSAFDNLNRLKNANIDPNSVWDGWPLDLAYESGWNECLNVIGTED